MHAPFQSTPPARGGDVSAAAKAEKAEISIHTPREGGRHQEGDYSYTVFCISIHAPARGATRQTGWLRSALR